MHPSSPNSDHRRRGSLTQEQPARKKLEVYAQTSTDNHSGLVNMRSPAGISLTCGSSNELLTHMELDSSGMECIVFYLRELTN